jgi:hypothetical protein
MKKEFSMQIALLVDTNNPAAVFEEVKNNFIRHYPIAAFTPVRAAFRDFNDLFDGRFPGYRACNTKFHDKLHTTDALLAITRLIDGYNLRHRCLPVEKVQIALIATLFHDAGYIQQSKDKKGTGAKYTLEHIRRSIAFMKDYFASRKLGKEAFQSAGRMVRCTGLSTAVETIPFKDENERQLGLMLAAADILGQMASRTYLERLLHLYREYKEGQVKGYDSEYDLLKKTLDFYVETKRRFEKTLRGVDRLAEVHFKQRYGIDENLYHTAIERQINYLRHVLEEWKTAYRKWLRRKA